MTGFVPPELQIDGEVEGSGELTPSQSQDLLALYTQRVGQPGGSEALDRKLVHLVIEHAKRIVRHPARPVEKRLEDFSRAPYGELALDDLLEESPRPDWLSDFLVEVTEPRAVECVAMLDASASMSGEKHLLASIAVAVLLLELEPRNTGLVVFSSKANVIKRMRAEESVESVLLRFLKTQPRGFTNISGGLEHGLREARRSARRRKIGLLATDGRSTEGGDPIEIARNFDFLLVLHLDGPGSHRESSEAMAIQGKGVCLPVERYEELPQQMYSALKRIAQR